MTDFARPDSRRPDQLRPIRFEPDFAPHAPGSVLACSGQTRVICAANLEKKVPPWMRQQGISGGWLTAEYSMLPYSTHERKGRDVNRGKPEGRTVEIQRLIGRALRAVLDLEKLPGYTLWIDCDVLQADGGTRTTAITGAYLAARCAIEKLISEGHLRETPFRDSIAAVSAGIYQGVPVLDLNYEEDKEASVDANFVMTGSGRFVEIQGSGEEATFTAEEWQSLLALGQKGIAQLHQKQEAYLAEHLPSSLDISLLEKTPSLEDQLT